MSYFRYLPTIAEPLTTRSKTAKALGDPRIKVEATPLPEAEVQCTPTATSETSILETQHSLTDSQVQKVQQVALALPPEEHAAWPMIRLGTPASTLSDSFHEHDSNFSPFTQSQKIMRTPPFQVTTPPIPPAAPAKLKPTLSLPHTSLSKSANYQLNPLDFNLREALNSIRQELIEMQVSGSVNPGIKSKIVQVLDNVIVEATSLQAILPSLKSEQRTNNIEKDIKEIKEAILAGQPKTWAQVASTKPQKTANIDIQVEIAKCEQAEKVKKAKAKTEFAISLRSANEQFRKELELLTEQTIAEQLQTNIRENVPGATDRQIREVKKVNPHLIKIQYNTEADKQKLESFNWERLIDRAKQVKPEYGIVIHGAPKSEIDSTDLNDIREKLEDRNHILISQAMPLTK